MKRIVRCSPYQRSIEQLRRVAIFNPMACMA